MKVIMVKSEEGIWEKDAPFLVEGVAGSVVLVTEFGKESTTFSGVLLSPDGSDYPLGEYRDDWVKSRFSLYIGQVALEN